MSNDTHVTGDSLSIVVPEFRFGDGQASQLYTITDELDITTPLIVTDPGIESAGIVAECLEEFSSEPARYLATTEPTTTDFTDIPASNVDGIIAIGGGSVLDTAKVLAILLEHGGQPESYLGVDNVPGPLVPVVAVPTTSGTGSQATQTAVISHEGVKRGISDEYLRPDIAIVDPLLTRNLPRGITARSGFDAFVHSLESLTARSYQWVPDRPIFYQGANPVSRSLSHRALELVYHSLEAAVFDGDNLEARRKMSLGSHLAGVAFSNAGLGIVHALASTVGGITDEPHGACLAASIETGLRYNLPVRGVAYERIARSLDIEESTDGEPGESLIREIDRLRATIGLPGSFSEIGLTTSDIDVMVENTLLQERRIATTPRIPGEDLQHALRTGFN